MMATMTVKTPTTFGAEWHNLPKRFRQYQLNDRPYKGVEIAGFKVRYFVPELSTYMPMFFAPNRYEDLVRLLFVGGWFDVDVVWKGGGQSMCKLTKSTLTGAVTLRGASSGTVYLQQYGGGACEALAFWEPPKFCHIDVSGDFKYQHQHSRERLERAAAVVA